mgnify:CR=1 FL=1
MCVVAPATGVVSSPCSLRAFSFSIVRRVRGVCTLMGDASRMATCSPGQESRSWLRPGETDRRRDDATLGDGDAARKKIFRAGGGEIRD